MSDSSDKKEEQNYGAVLTLAKVIRGRPDEPSSSSWHDQIQLGKAVGGSKANQRPSQRRTTERAARTRGMEAQPTNSPSTRLTRSVGRPKDPFIVLHVISTFEVSGENEREERKEASFLNIKFSFSRRVDSKSFAYPR